MTPRLIFVTHPEVMVDPERPVTDWDLSDTGRHRATRFAASPALAQVTQIWSSTERKARETAAILAAPRALTVTTDARLGENDRSATGFLPPDAFERAADAFFAAPDQSHRGWERAIDAQSRIAKAVRDILARHDTGDLAIVSHGAVGTLLFCALSGVPIDRRHDQPHQGHWWSAALANLVPMQGWQPIA